MGRSLGLRRLGAVLVLVVGAMGLSSSASVLGAETFTVNAVDDTSDGTCNSSHCSLREAVAAANATPAEDAVHFNIAGAGPHVITLTEGAFAFQPVTIDGTTEPGYAGTPIVQIDGTGMSSGDGVQFQGSGSVLRGVSVTNFPSFGVWLRGDDHVLESSWIGVAPDGSAAGNGWGVSVGGARNRVGGVGKGNVIADSFAHGVSLGSVDNVIEHNIIGLAPGGAAPVGPNAYSNLNGLDANGGGGFTVARNIVRDNVIAGNRQEGIQFAGTGATDNSIVDNLIGTDAAAETTVGNGPSFRGISLAFGAHANEVDGNVVAGAGIGIQMLGAGTVDNVITSNFVGTNADGDALPNRTGILAYVGPNTIGGSTAGDGNVIQHNQFHGVQVANPGDGPPTRVRISGNSIDENGLSAIDLQNVSTNDPLDADGFENDGQNHPVVATATGDSTSITITGTLDSNADEAFRVELFASPVCDGSGKGEAARFLGAVDVTTDAAGHAPFSPTLTAAVANGEVITATAIDSVGNTSELSSCQAATIDTSSGLTVNTLADVDDGTCNTTHCSLREAINAANGSPERDSITFSVAGSIGATSSMPTITAPVDIDGGTDPGCAGTPAVMVDGSGAPSLSVGLDLGPSAGGSTIRGLAVSGWTGSGIMVRSDDNVVQCSYVGTNLAGTAALANRFGIDIQNGNDNLVGGTGAGQGNLVSGNQFQGVQMSGFLATGNVVKGNYIGTDVTGMLAIGNLGFGGVNVGSTGNIVGGLEPGARNLISGNNQGVRLPNASTNHVIEGNWIGVDATGNAPLPNTADGVSINGVPVPTPGTPASTGTVIRHNVISGNRNSGVQIAGIYAINNTIEDNLIGVGADGVTAIRNGVPGFPTTGWGVLTTSGNTTIRHNTIRNNATGVAVGFGSQQPTGVLVSENSIADHTVISIDLDGDGATANDAGDGDTGSNNRQNHPVVTSATTASVAGTLDTTPSTLHRVEVFASGDCSPAPDAARFLGFADVTTDAAGHADFTVPVTGVSVGELISSTATAANNTSEVSPCIAATAAAGRVRVQKATDPGGGTGFTFTGPTGASSGADGDLQAGRDTIAFVDTETDALALLDVATGDVTPVPASTAARHPEWSPDGSKIAYVTGGTLKVLDLETMTSSILPTTGVTGTKFSPTWSPDGDWIAFHHFSPEDIYVVPSNGSTPPTLLTGADTSDRDPVWGPDGRIAFRRSGAPHDIYVGTFNPTTVTLDGITGLANSAGMAGPPREMDWSPDGTRLIAGVATVNAQDDLYLLQADGSGTAQQLTEGEGWDSMPSWAPDGEQIVYVRDLGGSPHLGLVDPANGETTLTDLESAPALDPAWGRWASSESYTLDDGDTIGGYVTAGSSVTFTEEPTEGWLLQEIDCGDHPRAVVDGSSVTFTPAAGDDILCTFTNVEEPDTGTITIEKQTLPNGDPTAFTFSGAVSGTLRDGESISVTVPIGEHVVTETMPATFWLPSSITCDDEDSTGDPETASATIQVDLDETVRCVFTNRGYGRVRVGKVSDPAGGTGFQFVETVGTNPPGSPMTIDDGQTLGGYGPAGLQRRFAELTDPAWTLASIDCDDHPRAAVDLESRAVTFTPGVGDDILCTFTNVEAPGTIIVEKQTLPDGDPTSFDFSGALAASLTDGESESVTVAAGEHTVTEALPSAAWTLDSIVCDDDNSGGDLPTRTATFRVAPGETVRCVFTNQGHGRVTIVKRSDPTGGTGFTFTEQVGTDPSTQFTLDDGGSRATDQPAGVAATVTEAAKPGWALSSISCGAHPRAVPDLANRRVTVTPAPGDDITCTFTNEGRPSITATLFQRNLSTGSPVGTQPLTGVQPGDQLNYIAMVGNSGTATARGVTVTLPIPARARLAPGGLSPGCSASSANVVCTLPDIPPGQARDTSIVVHLTFGCDIAGSRGDDNLSGGAAGEMMCGFAGNDVLVGAGGADHILGDTPVTIDLSDLVVTATAGWTAPAGGGTQPSNAVVASLQRGLDGNDTINGNAGDDTAFGQDGNDTLRGETGVDRLYGGNGTDSIFGDAGGDELAGGPGDDTLNGGDNDDWLHGDQDRDTLRGDGHNDLVSGDGESDFLVSGGSGNDHVSGDDGNDVVRGDAGTDRASGDAGNDDVGGGDGNDHGEVRLNHPLQGTPVFGNAGAYGGEGNDFVHGDAGDDDAAGNDGRDLVTGGTENDVLYGDEPGGGATDGDGLPDGLSGGPGDDTVFGQLGNNVTTESVGNSFGSARAGLWGDADDDWVVGSSGADDAFGGAGSDALQGGAGRDRLAGDLGDENGANPSGDGAPDRVVGDAGSDLIYGQGGNDGTPTCSGKKCIVSKFTAGAPRRPAGGGGPTLFGGDNRDVIHGGAGNDRLDGGPEDGNTLIGADNKDFCSFGPSPGDIRDRSCEDPSAGTTTVAPSVWSWAAFRP